MTTTVLLLNDPPIPLDLKPTRYYNEDEKNDIYTYFIINPHIRGFKQLLEDDLLYIKNTTTPTIDTNGDIFWKIAEYYFGYGKFMHLYANKNYIVGYTGVFIPNIS
jgi:ribonucleotide monophosphatase NagD (HAD superfamily)